MKPFNTILIVDDDDDDRDMFCEAVGQVNKQAKCICASNGEEALKLLRQKESKIPDYIFLDMNMPRLPGKDCLKEIKKIDKMKSVPVIMYSTSDSKEDRRETQLLGAVEYLLKPTDFNLLCRQIHTIFGKAYASA